MIYKMCWNNYDKTKKEHFTLTFCKRSAKIKFIIEHRGKIVTMAMILVLKYFTTSELSSNIWLLGTFLKYKLAVTIFT